MTCGRCGAAAVAGQRFCGNCGNPLAAICPSCGTANPPENRFCGTCGTPLAPGTPGPVAATPTPVASGPAPEPVADAPRPGGPVAERRLVSVLFADLVGFTTYSEGRDAEEVRETLSRYFDIASETIGRYGGTVEKFIGDAVMAVWGTPTAREDDTERAVRAGLELVDAVKAMGSGIEARAGVLTGETAVTLGATNQGMVAGDLVNTASRIQSVAPPSTVLVGEATMRAASAAIAFEPAGEHVLKGKASPVPAWRALRVIAERGGRNRTDQLEPPFVGRDVELRQLKDAFHAVGQERRNRHISIIGTGGVGKSRLAWELEKYLDGIEQRLWWHHGRSPAYGQGITFWALGEMIRQRARLLETDGEAATRAKVTELLDLHMAAHPDRRWVETALLQLLGFGGGLPSNELFGAWRTFFEALASTGTVVLVFQDMHWADSGTLDFIDHLVEWARNQPIFVVSLARPDLLERRPEWTAARRGYTTQFLEPLSDASMHEIVLGLVPDMPTSAVTAIVKRSEGIPLYAIETIRMLLADGRVVVEADGVLTPRGNLSELAVPETLTALIAARLDTLEPADRALALDAAVLGQSFTVGGLAAVTGLSPAEMEPRLRSLVRRELLTSVADPRSPERGQYAFVQALIREVAYNTLSKKDRKTRHLAAARWFESLGESELVGALAGHYLAAKSLASEGAEADALAAQARIALKAAGERAESLGASRQALAFFEQALEVTTDPAEEADVHRRAGAAATQASDYDAAERHYRRAIELHRSRSEREAAADMVAALGLALVNGRRMDAALEVLEAGASEFADLADHPARLTILSQTARFHYLSGANAKALPFADEVLLIGERTEQWAVVADTLVTKGGAVYNLGRRREGLGIADAGYKLAEERGNVYVMLRAINNTMANRTEVDPRATFEAGSAGLALARRLGQTQWVNNFVGNLAFVTLRTGEFATGLSELENALAEIQDANDRLLLINNLVDIQAFLGLPTGASLHELTEGVARSDRSDAKTFLFESEAFVALFEGRLEDARAKWRDLYDIDPASNYFARVWAARMALWAGDADAAEADLADFWQNAPRDGVPVVSRDIIRAGIAAVRGSRDVAVDAYRDALARLRNYRIPVDEVIATIDIVATLGPTEPISVEAIGDARRAIEKMGATSLNRLLESAIATAPPTVAEKPSMAARRVDASTVADAAG
ncbi:MAG TPA: adenylate/guanylate cyclase domain-containing protein [Candidatus Limnocylindrales bacterium]